MKYIFLVSIIFFNLFSNDVQILSSTKQNIIELKQKQAKEKEQVNYYDWLNDINAKASISTNEDDQSSEDYSLSLSQDIYKFGGITSQKEYAKELSKMELININIDTKDDISTLYSTLIDIKLNNINIKQNSLNIDNSLIEIKNKLSSYKEGETDISDLNDAIMNKNGFKDTQKKLQLTKLTNINTIKKYTTQEHENITIPNVQLISKEFFIQHALSTIYASSNVKVNNSLYKIKKSDYLPSLSANADVGYNNDNYYNYGLSITMPLSYSSSNDIEQKRLEYLISEQELNDEKIDASITYDSAILSIENYQERISLANEDIKLYAELLKTTEEEYEAGYKTIDDVQSLKNSMNMRELDIKTYNLNIQKQLLNLYFKLES